MRRVSSPILLLAGALILIASLPARPAVPAGFEMLAEEQTSVVDVYYGNQFLVSVLATFSPVEIRFANPAEIIPHIPDLLDPAEIEAALKAPLAAHNELLCLRKGQSHCGVLFPDVAEVIFDETRFRVDLFIHPRYLAVRELAIDRYLPPSDAGTGLLQTFSSAFGGSPGEHLTYSVNAATTVSRSESRVGMVSNYSDRQGLKIDALALQRAIRGHESIVGLFRSQSSNLTFLSQVDLLGARVGTSLDTLANLDQVEGNELTIFLPARSRIDIYKDDRLYSSRLYELGNQELDTSQLPGGAYDVKLVIRDDFGQTREETRFYVKSSRLPPRGESLYFFDVGEIRERQPDARIPRSTGDAMVRGGLSRRLADHIAIDLGGEFARNEALIESGTAYFTRGGELHGNLAVSDRGDFALVLTGRGRIRTLSFAGSLRKSWVGDEPGLIGASLRQVSFNIGGPVGPGRLQFDVNINDRGAARDRTYSGTYDFNGWRVGKQQIDLSFQLARNNGDLQSIVNFDWRWQAARWSAGVRPRFQQTRFNEGGTASEWQTTGLMTWNRSTTAQQTRMTVRAMESAPSDSVEYEVDHLSNNGRTQVNLDYSNGAGSNRLRYGGTFASSIIADSEGVSFGGRDQSQSAIVIDLEGVEGDGYFEVMIDGSPNTIARLGERTVVLLHPFKTYSIYLQDRGAAYLQYDDQVRHVTLYPGNVVTLKWQVSEVIVVFGHLERADGTAVANALLKNLPGLATTDENGFFQAQMPANQPEIEARTLEGSCIAKIGAYQTRQNIGLLGNLLCE